MPAEDNDLQAGVRLSAKNRLQAGDRYLVKGPQEAVAFFHQGTNALRRLTPPPIFVQLHRVEPLAENSRSEFTLWFGPLPVRWLAIHSQVGPHGFTDRQARGPMKFWEHRHQWQAVDACTTVMEEQILYEHHPGLAGLLSRLLFAPPLLRLMLAYRKWVIRRAVERAACP